MKPQDVNKIQELLWMGVPKKNRTDIRGMTNTAYLTPKRVVLIMYEPKGIISDDCVRFYGNGSMERMPKIEYDALAQSVQVDTKYLKDIVNNINSPTVRLMVNDDKPLLMSWSTDTDSTRAYIAPRIDTEERS